MKTERNFVVGRAFREKSPLESTESFRLSPSAFPHFHFTLVFRNTNSDFLRRNRVIQSFTFSVPPKGSAEQVALLRRKIQLKSRVFIRRVFVNVKKSDEKNLL